MPDGPSAGPGSRSIGTGTWMSGFRAPDVNGGGPSLNVLLPGGVEGGPSEGEGVGVSGGDDDGEGVQAGVGLTAGPSCGDGKPGPGVTIVPGGGAAYPGGGP